MIVPADIMPLIMANALIDAVMSVIIALWLVRRGVAADAQRMFGIIRVRNKAGAEVYAPIGPDGNPISVPVGVDAKGESVTDYAPLAYSMPYVAALLARDMLMSKVTGKAGKLRQMADAAVRADMPLDQASQAMALEAFARGQYGRALMAYLAPRMAEAVRSGAGMPGTSGNNGTNGGRFFG